MADRNDEMTAALATAISEVYNLLLHVCRLLPVPITLPISDHVPAPDAIPAIRRVAQLVPEQPIAQDASHRLYTAAIHLLSALDLYALCSVSYHDTRADGVDSLLQLTKDELETLELLLLNHSDPRTD
ncbi:hypothetical protein [Streptomyces antibioticus]|uniref:hypothetical protein n=1 Tax=Streptomyces antibioticus TaxID=1890 RepID=UPI0036FC079F